MKKKTNIYDSDDADRSKRLSFTPEERAARAQQKAEILGQKLERAEKKIPKKKKVRLQKELDPEKSRMKHTLRFEEVEKQRGKEALPKKASRRMVQTASAAVHSKMYQVEEENVGTKAAHRTELTAEATVTMAAHAARVHHQNAPYKKVEKLQQQANQANVNAAYRAAVRDNPELQTNNVKRFVQKQRIKRQYAKEYRKAQKAGSKGSAAAKKAKDAVSSTEQAVIAAIKNHKGGLVVFGVLALLTIMLFSSLSCLVAVPTMLFMAISVFYALLKLKTPPLDLMLERSRTIIKHGRESAKNLSFLQSLKQATIRSKKLLVFFVAFSAFCFSAMVQMSLSMTDLASETMAWMIFIIGLILSFVTLLLSLSNVVKGNTKTIAMMRVFGYDYALCSNTVLGSYRLFSYVGFMIGTLYQYGLLKLILTFVFSGVEDMPTYNFNWSALLITLVAFLATYELIMLFFSLKIKKQSLKSVMME